MNSGPLEQPSCKPEIDGPTNKRFGLVVGGILLAIGAARTYLNSEIGLVGWAFVLIGLALMLAALGKPEMLGAANRGWSALGLVLHKITNPLFLAAIYIVAIVPTSLLMRAFRIDSLALRSDKRESYWLPRTRAGSTKRSLERPF